VFVLGKPFEPSLLFASKARSVSKSRAPERCSTCVGLGLKLQTARLERPAIDKHFSLLRKFVNFGRKKCITLAPGPNIIKLYESVIYECS